MNLSDDEKLAWRLLGLLCRFRPPRALANLPRLQLEQTIPDAHNW